MGEIFDGYAYDGLKPKAEAMIKAAIERTETRNAVAARVRTFLDLAKIDAVHSVRVVGNNLEITHAPIASISTKAQ